MTTDPNTWPAVLAALQVAQATLVNPSPPPFTSDPFDYATATVLAHALANLGSAYKTRVEVTVSIPPARIYAGVAPDGSSIVSFSEIPSMPLQVTPDELFKAGKYLMTLCGVTGTMFDHPMPPCPTVSIPITNGQTIVQPDTSFALGWAYVARDAYLAVVAPSALAISFWGTLGDPDAVPPVPPSGFLPMMAEAAVWANYIRSFPVPVYFPGTLVAETTVVTTTSLPVDDTTLLALLTAIENAESFTTYLLS